MAFSSAFRGMLGGHLMPSSIFQSQFASLRFCSTLTTSKLFVSGLSRYTSDEGLKKAFEQFGQLVDGNEIAALYLAKFQLEAKVITDRATGRSKGFGFVTYETIEEAQKAREGMNAKFLDGWVIFVDPAKPKEVRPPPQSESESATFGIRSNKTIGWSG